MPLCEKDYVQDQCEVANNGTDLATDDYFDVYENSSENSENEEYHGKNTTISSSDGDGDDGGGNGSGDAAIEVEDTTCISASLYRKLRNKSRLLDQVRDQLKHILSNIDSKSTENYGTKKVLRK